MKKKNVFCLKHKNSNMYGEIDYEDQILYEAQLENATQFLTKEYAESINTFYGNVCDVVEVEVTFTVIS